MKRYQVNFGLLQQTGGIGESWWRQRLQICNNHHLSFSLQHTGQSPSNSGSDVNLCDATIQFQSSYNETFFYLCQYPLVGEVVSPDCGIQGRCIFKIKTEQLVC